MVRGLASGSRGAVFCDKKLRFTLLLQDIKHEEECFIRLFPNIEKWTAKGLRKRSSDEFSSTNFEVKSDEILFRVFTIASQTNYKCNNSWRDSKQNVTKFCYNEDHISKPPT